MKLADRDYVINTVFRTNILPVTSECNTSCVFCSHRQNPENIEVFRLQKMHLQDFVELSDFLSPNKKIIIGESASRLIEGEPLVHREFPAILSMLREKFKSTPISITTNGILLDEGLISEMVRLGNIELNISLNSVHPVKRRQILGLKAEDNIREKIRSIQGRLKFSGSFVWIPGLLEWEDVEEMVALLDECGAESVRMFLPGYTSRAGMEKIPDFFEMLESARNFVEKLKDAYEIPVIVEPSFVRDLEARVEGVIRNTPAYKAGVKAGDIILSVNNEAAATRVEAFNRAYRLRNPVLEVQRGGGLLNIKLEKGRNCSPGFVLMYDIDPGVNGQVLTAVRRHQATNVLFITSELAGEVLSSLFEKENFAFNYKILRAANAFFGGTIKCAGLLTVQDILDAAGEYLKENEKPDLIILPPIMFDHTGRDITGRNIKEAEDCLKIAVDTL